MSPLRTLNTLLFLYGKITLNPHVAHMWPTCVVPISRGYPHVRNIFQMWDTCEVLQTHVDIMCPTCDPHETTCGHNYVVSCGLLSLNITHICEMNVWNWNNTQNPHVNFMWFFLRENLLGSLEGSDVNYVSLQPYQSSRFNGFTISPFAAAGFYAGFWLWGE